MVSKVEEKKSTPGPKSRTEKKEQPGPKSKTVKEAEPQQQPPPPPAKTTEKEKDRSNRREKVAAPPRDQGGAALADWKEGCTFKCKSCDFIATLRYIRGSEDKSNSLSWRSLTWIYFP